jgi:hypothetical protein
MPLQYGRKPYQPDSRDFKLSELADVERLAATLPDVGAPRGGYGADFQTDMPSTKGGWGALGNAPQDDGTIPMSWAAAQGAGDCVLASRAHQHMEKARNAGRVVPLFTCLSTIQEYAAYTEWATPGQGYDPVSGSNDNGCDIRTNLKWSQTIGMRDAKGNVHKTGPYVLVDCTNAQEMWVALALSESLEMGIVVYDKMMQQFMNDQMPWVVHYPWTADGGHDFPIFGHPTAVLWTGNTWSRRQTITQNCLLTVAEEAWISLDPLQFNAVTGKEHEGYTAAAVASYFQIIAQETPQPLSKPQPAPSPPAGGPTSDQPVSSEAAPGPDPETPVPTPAEVPSISPQGEQLGQVTPPSVESTQEEPPPAPSYPAVAASKFPEVSLDSMTGRSDAALGSQHMQQRSQRFETGASPDEYRQQRAQGDDWGPSEMLGPFPGV